MLAWVLHGNRDLRVEQRPDPSPLTNEVLIQVECVGICGSDIHYFRHGKVGLFKPSRPFILGHEVAGCVIATGNTVKGIKIGDRVAVDPLRACLECAWCRQGAPNLCPKVRYLGSAATSPPVDGALCDLITMPASNCHLLGDDMSYVAGAMLEPLSVACHAVLRSRLIVGHSIVITGGGTIGLLVATVARALGAAHIVIVDPREAARRAAETRADEVIDPINNDKIDSPTVIFEASGSPSALHWAIEAISHGGTIVQIGSIQDKIEMPLNLIMTKELSLVGSFRYASGFQIASSLLSAKRIEVESLVTATLPFPQTDTALKRACDDPTIIKHHVSR